MPTRREFLETAIRAMPALATFDGPCAVAIGESGAAVSAIWRGDLQDRARTAPRARYWVSGAATGADCAACHTVAVPLDTRHVHRRDGVACQLCAQACVIKAGDRGRCRARINVGGELRSLSYGRPLAVHVDPIEKKPFYHFLPGVSAWSFGTAGCPLRCQFCQNWEISQANPEDYDVPYLGPAAAVERAREQQCPVIAFTYNEPTVFAEYLLDVAALARTRGLRSVMVSCGFATERPLAEMCVALDAIKIDLKGFSDDFYRRVSGATLAPVLRSLVQIRKSGTHLEVVNLVVPTLNDRDDSLRGLADWLMGELGPDVPLHFTRFHPDFQLQNLPPTPVATLERARAMAMDRGLRYVYVGNVPGHSGNHTYCPQCRGVVIRRENFFVSEIHMKNGACAACGARIAGVWA
jgi:pyruvate formate lyase activating enzyme